MERHGKEAKSMYSLILSDEVVSAVDRLAYQMNTSRSGMINRILAEYVSLLTPEKRIQTVFDEIQQLLAGTGFQLLMKPTSSMLSLRQALNYKYNPTMRYSIERINMGGVWRLQLKVLLRSQNQSLIRYLNQFFRIWQEVENQLGNVKNGWSIEDARYLRPLQVPPEEVSDEDFGQQIARYIQALDQAMNLYFEHLPADAETISMIGTVYQAYLQDSAYPIK
ncbi:MAG: hypothetical protein J6P72_03635 [Firmicutes bacterium]|nr:hypothetical protein [Bacillota bacterium]